jgi:hypothetical protein
MASPKAVAIERKYTLLRTPAVIAMLMLFGTTAAFPLDWTPAEENLMKFFFHESLTPENRIELTRRIAAYCDDVLDKVPTNTPAEEAWVMSEYKSDGGDTDRMNRLVSSKEWARYRLKDTFSECLQQVALLQQAQTQKARSAEAEYFKSVLRTPSIWSGILVRSPIRSVREQGYRQGR